MEDIEPGVPEGRGKAAPAAARAGGQRRATLSIRDGKGGERTLVLEKQVITCGRDERNDICVRDAKCSRKHFVIEMAGDFYNAIDMGSTNGLLVNKRRVAKRRLCDGDVITIGAYRITYHGPTDDLTPDEPLEPAGRRAPEPAEQEPAVVVPELVALPEEGAAEAPAEAPDDGPVPLPAAPPGPEECPQCKTPLPDDQPCAQCGHKSLRLRAIEYFVDNIGKSRSLLGGLGLWPLKRKKIFQQALAAQDIPWVLSVLCPKCAKEHRVINEWRPHCIPCEGCGEEISVPYDDPPRLS